jgi:hypothetical protein
MIEENRICKIASGMMSRIPFLGCRDSLHHAYPARSSREADPVFLKTIYCARLGCEFEPAATSLNQSFLSACVL